MTTGKPRFNEIKHNLNDKSIGICKEFIPGHKKPSLYFSDGKSNYKLATFGCLESAVIFQNFLIDLLEKGWNEALSNLPGPDTEITNREN